MLESIIEKIVSELTKYARSDLKNRDQHYHRGDLKLESCVICEPRVWLQNNEEITRIKASLDTYYPDRVYDESYISRFIDGFLHSYESCNSLIDQLSSSDSQDFVGPPPVARLYVMLFCRKVLSDFLLKQELETDQVKLLTSNFLMDLKQRSLDIKTIVGLDGIATNTETTIQDENSTYLIRSPREGDLSSRVLVPDRWEGELEARNSPRFPTFTAVVKIHHNKFQLHMMNNLFLNIKWYDSSETFDPFIGAVRKELHKLFDLIMLFQSKQSPVIKRAVVEFSLSNLSNEPIYVKNISLKEDGTEINDPFVITEGNRDSILLFWDRMSKAKFIERIYGPIEENSSHLEHFPKPIEVAFKRYVKILSENVEYQVRIHDTVETLEGLFTPEKIESYEDYKKYAKIFIRRIPKLMEIFEDLDLNMTSWALEQGFGIRSDYSHRSSGWDEHSNIKDRDEDSLIEISKWNSSLDFKSKLASLLLNYLRICIVSRILAGIPDKEFVHSLDSGEGINELKWLLIGFKDAVSAYPLIKLEPQDIKCRVCNEILPVYVFSMHVENKHLEEFKKQNETTEFTNIRELAALTAIWAFGSKTDKHEYTLAEIHNVLQGSSTFFRLSKYFVSTTKDFLMLCGGLFKQTNKGKYIFCEN